MHTDLTPQQCADVLNRHYYGHLACHNKGELYLVPFTYVYVDNALCAYTQEGKKVDMMRTDPKVCVQVEEIHRDGSWESVIVWGAFSEIKDQKEAQQTFIKLADSFALYNNADHPMISPLIREISNFDWEHSAPVVYKITIEKMTGRAERT